MLGIIRVRSESDRANVERHGQLMRDWNGTQAISVCIPDQPNGIYDEATHTAAVPKIVAAARELQRERDVGAITISCAADPGLAEARAAVSIPVYGAGHCGATIARALTTKVAAIGITPEPPANLVRILGPALHSYSSVTGLNRTTDLSDERAHEALLAPASAAQQAGAGALLFACTGFSTIGLADYLSKHLSLPIVDLVRAQAAAYTLTTLE